MLSTLTLLVSLIIPTTSPIFIDEVADGVTRIIYKDKVFVVPSELLRGAVEGQTMRAMPSTDRTREGMGRDDDGASITL